jgi:hypothetical protein
MGRCVLDRRTLVGAGTDGWYHIVPLGEFTNGFPAFTAALRA